MRLIDADALKENIPQTEQDCGTFGENCTMLWKSNVIEIIDNAPTIDAVPVVYAVWSGFEIGWEDGAPVYDEWECSNCGQYAGEDEPKWNYCPGCGAEMEKGEL